jgi:hypothetical protein
MNQIKVKAEAEIKPTEDPEKVKRAIQNLILNPAIKTFQTGEKSLLIAEAEGEDGLSKLYNLFRQERIRDAARKLLFKGMKGNTITFYLNKQVAYVEHISFCKPIAESPLGPIKIEITCNDPRALIDWLAPSSVAGRAGAI